jgi:hypothetical protein
MADSAVQEKPIEGHGTHWTARDAGHHYPVLADLEAVARKDPMILTYLRECKAGRCNLQQAMLAIIVTLADEKQRALRSQSSTDSLFRNPLPLSETEKL